MKLIFDGEHFELIVEGWILKARNRIWIASANLKDLHVPGGSRRSRPLLSHLYALSRNGVGIRIIHGARPSAPFSRTLRSMEGKVADDGFEMLHCPRNHSKLILIDGRFAYTGSANLTGAGMGARSERTRNFEAGVCFTDPENVGRLEEYFDGIWMGRRCEGCGRKKLCPGPVSFR